LSGLKHNESLPHSFMVKHTYLNLPYATHFPNYNNYSMNLMILKPFGMKNNTTSGHVISVPFPLISTVSSKCIT